LLRKAGELMTTEDDLFADCELDEIFALFFDQAGAEGLQELLAQVKLVQQELVEAAGKLEQAGLFQSAGIVRDAAKQAPTRASVEIAASMADDDEIQCRAYLASAYRRCVITIDDMVLAGVDPKTLKFAAKARQ
jgi:hypothetical protein